MLGQSNKNISMERNKVWNTKINREQRKQLPLKNLNLETVCGIQCCQNHKAVNYMLKAIDFEINYTKDNLSSKLEKFGFHCLK